MAKPATTTNKKPLSKSEVLNAIGEAVGEEVPRKHVKQVVEILVDIGHKELEKNGVFVLHGFAKFVVVKKPGACSIHLASLASLYQPPPPSAAVTVACRTDTHSVNMRWTSGRARALSGSVRVP